MTDITSVLNEALNKHSVSLVKLTRADLHNVDEFLKEAYRIVGGSFRPAIHPFADIPSLELPYLNASYLPQVNPSSLPVHATPATKSTLPQKFH